jgi:hypothetical protein
MESVHLFGLDHFLQPVEPGCITPAGQTAEAEMKAALAATLSETISGHHVDLIAEEAHPTERYLGMVLAEQFGLPHIDITMPPDERARRGIPFNYEEDPDTRTRAYREFERYMLACTTTRNAQVSLVICGREHLPGLEQLFVAAGVNVFVYDLFRYEWYRGIPLEDGVNIVGYNRDPLPEGNR